VAAPILCSVAKAMKEVMAMFQDEALELNQADITGDQPFGSDRLPDALFTVFEETAQPAGEFCLSMQRHLFL